MLSDEQKIDMLYKYKKNKDKLSTKQIERIMSWVNDKNALVRYEVAECLIQENPANMKVLIRLGKDRDENVRIRAYTTLSSYSTKEAEVFLKKAMRKENRGITLANAIGMWSAVTEKKGKNLEKKLKYIKHFEKKRKVKKSAACIQACRTARYLFGETEMLDKILKQMNHPNRRVRYNTLIDLEYIYNDENKEKIIPYVKKALKDSSKKVAMEARSILNYK